MGSSDAGRNSFLPDQQAGRGRQEGIPDDAVLKGYDDGVTNVGFRASLGTPTYEAFILTLDEYDR